MGVYQVYPTRKKSKFDFWKNLSLTKKIIAINVFFILFYFLARLGVIPWKYLALNPGNAFQGLYLWTFLTSMFMHRGIFHLFVNMLSLFFVGSLVEKILGKRRYLGFYLIAGLFSGVVFVLSALIIPSDMGSFAVGASGALFGLIGLLVFLTPNLPVYLMFIPIPIKMKYAAPGILILLWVISVAGNVPLGNFAHLGGLIVGLVYGFYLRQRFPNKIKYLERQFS